MNVTLRGVRGGIAASSPETTFYGGNTSCVEVRTDSGIVLFLDAGSGLRQAGEELPESGEAHVCITHSHMDHIAGLWFFKPIHSPAWTTHLYLPAWLDPLPDWYYQCGLFPVPIERLRGKVIRYRIRAGETFTLGPEAGGGDSPVLVEPFAVHHPGGGLGYRVSANGAVLVYTGDHEITAEPAAREEAVNMLRGADLAVVDAQYDRSDYQPGFGHSTWEDWLEAAEKADVRQLALSHHHPGRSDQALHNLASTLMGAPKKGQTRVLVAREGLRFSLSHDTTWFPELQAADHSRSASLENDRLTQLMRELLGYKDTSTILDRVLAKAREATGADAGTIFLADGDDLVFAFTHNDSLFSADDAHKYAYAAIRLPISENCIAGYVAATGTPLNLADVRSLPSGVPYAFNDAFDRKTGFVTKSMLTLPFLDASGKNLGVLQLINSLDPSTKAVGRFSPEMEQHCRMLAREVSGILERKELEKRVIFSLLRMAAVHDPFETGPHAERVGAIAAELYHAWALRRGYSLDTIRHEKDLLRLTSMLHDIGKVGVSESILKKPGILTDEEFTVMRSHTTLGASILEEANTGELAPLARDIALHHHQKWNGQGYAGSGDEGRLAGEDIPIGARVTAIADVFDALISPRCYKEPWTFDQAMEVLRREAGGHFDPELIECMAGLEELFHNIYAAFPDKR
ncbi:MAG: MBL fold metallo-hydrolase [Desulfovibrionaceae bacterium]|nr:MBL fold metallo-hydrolase [Desulfovibrionaceae bacterium]